MIDNEFDNFVNGKLKDHAAPVPAGLWDKLTDAQFDSFISGKLQDHPAPVPADLWEKITDPTAFDGFISGKLKDYTAAIPSGLWEKVRPEEKDRRKGFVLFRNPGMAVALALLLLAGTLGGYLYVTSEKKTDNSSSELNSKKNAGKTGTSEIPGSSAPGENNANAAAPATNDEPIPVEQKTTDGIPATPQPATKDATVKLDKSVAPAHAPAAAHTPSSLTDTKKAPENSLILPGISLNSTRKGSKENNGQPPLKEDASNSNNASSKNSNNVNRNVTDNTVNTNNSKGISKTDTDDNSFDFIEPYQTNLLTGVTIPSAPKPFNSLFDLTGKQLTAGNHTKQFKNVIICPSDRKNRNTDWHLEVYTSPDLAFRSVTNNSASSSFLLRKDSSESMRIGYTAGIRLVKPITENILLKTGLQYSQINQKYVYRTENEVKTTTVVSVRTIIRAPGDTVIVRDTSILQQIGYKNNTVINRFRSFDIPVTVGYQFGNEDLKIGINAGVIFNVSSWYQGVILDSSLATVPLVKGSPAMVYKSNIGLGLYGGISIVKRLSDDMHVFAEPYFRYNLSNMTTPRSSYNQKFSLGGISIGLRFNLNRQ
jgi:opacity protein-like surface antigen